MTIQIATVSVDAVEPQRLAEFWSEVLGWAYGSTRTATCSCGPRRDTPTTVGPATCCFWPFPRRSRGRTGSTWTWFPTIRPPEMNGSRPSAPGAPRSDRPGNESWVVLADPEGNEFCVLGPR